MNLRPKLGSVIHINAPWMKELYNDQKAVVIETIPPRDMSLFRAKLLDGSEVLVYITEFEVMSE